MNIIIIILLVVAGIITLLLFIALFMKKEHYVNREIIINAPRQKVFDFLKLLKNQDQFNKWVEPFADRGNMEIFKSRKDAEDFAKVDPFILEGLVKSFVIRAWNDSLLPE